MLTYYAQIMPNYLCLSSHALLMISSLWINNKWLKHKLTCQTSNWSTPTDLPFNESKFIHLRFFLTTTVPPTYTINGNPIKCLAQHKDLGVTFTSDFSWSAHYNNILYVRKLTKP